MKKLYLLISLSLIFLSWGNDPKQLISENEAFPYSELIKKCLNNYPNGTQFSIALIRNNDLSFIGLRKMNDSLVLVNNKDSVFEIGSITKVFTSTILADLVYHQVLNLDDEIANLLPFKLKQSEKNGKQITLRTLANHTSGLSRDPENNLFEKYPDNPFGAYSNDSLNNYLQNIMTINSTPGERYLYSNLGMGLLGYLLEIKTGKSYENLLQDKIFLQYNMIYSSTERRKIQNHIIKGQDSTGRIIPNWDLNAMNAAGAILSNVCDLSKFVIANFSNDAVLSFQRQQTYWSDDNNLALGWHMIKYSKVDCHYWYTHEGGTGGYRSSVFMDTDNKIAAIVLSNVSVYHADTKNIGKLGYELLKNLYISEKASDSKSKDAPFIELALLKGWGTKLNDSINKIQTPQIPIVGVWQKQIGDRIITRTFMPNNKVQSDFYGDSEIDVWGYCNLENTTITLKDEGGAVCDSFGKYEYIVIGDTLKFSLITDQCDGRRNGLEGIWIKKK